MWDFSERVIVIVIVSVSLPVLVLFASLMNKGQQIILLDFVAKQVFMGVALLMCSIVVLGFSRYAVATDASHNVGLRFHRARGPFVQFAEPVKSRTGIRKLDTINALLRRLWRMSC